MQTDLIKYFEIITIKFKIPLYAAGAVKREKIEKWLRQVGDGKTELKCLNIEEFLAQNVSTLSFQAANFCRRVRRFRVFESIFLFLLRLTEVAVD